ncbi:hypothetical protein [Cupriavidus sp. SW-Y-13]|uniref:hypothetical protein n=1 Tax=Cupriavidus sp. SW-Y-13 TaxID=2653854 RepID=UPI001365E3CB|nr:hypothetical protein [Cupriavidus sp. SW-Y-13]MWL90521.1 hypothetical protein [Cupriavidus sp. SW-Y-13]
MTMPLDASSLADIAAGTQAGGAARGNGTPVDSRAWQREMERAQTQDWFQGAVAYRQHGMAAQADDAHPADAVGTAAPSAGTTVRALSATVQHVAIQAIRLGLGTAELATPPASTQIAPALAWQASLDTPNAVQPAAKDPPVAARAASAASITSPSLQRDQDGDDLPMRLHVEVDESGARLWIGMTAPTNEQIEQAVSEVRRRLAERGIALAGVTCNGKAWQQNLSAHADTAQPAPYSKEGVIHGIDR